MRFFSLLIITALFPLLSFAQDLSVTVDIDSGVLGSVYIKEGNTVFKVGHSSGSIQDVYIFQTHDKAQYFMKNPQLENMNFKSVRLAGGVTLYVRNYTNIEYCKNYSNYSRAGIVGEICGIDAIKIEYNLRIGNNSALGIVGKIKNLNGIVVKYHTNYDSNVRAGFQGKISDISNTKIEYYNKYTTSELANYYGKFKSIGGVAISYYDKSNLTKGFEGKLKNVGSYQFNYYENYYNNQASKIVGKFKSITGNDSRVTVL